MNCGRRLAGWGAVLAILGIAAGMARADWASEIGLSNPIHWYRLNETSGTTAYDSTTNGTPMNGTYQFGYALNRTGTVDGAVALDGNNGKVFLGGDFLTPSSHVWSAEFVVKRTNAVYALLLSASNNAHTLKLTQITFTNELGFDTAGNNWRFTPTANSPQVDEYAHIVWVGNPGDGAYGSVKVFVNGQWMGSNTNRFMPLPQHYIGRNNNPGPRAVVDEVVLYDRILSDDEIRAHARAANVLPPATRWSTAIGVANPIHWYRLNERNGYVTAVDATTNGTPLHGAYDKVYAQHQGQQGPVDGAVAFGATNRIILGGNYLDTNSSWAAEFVLRRTRDFYSFLLASTTDIYGLMQCLNTYTNEMGYNHSGVSSYRFTPSVLGPATNEFVHLVFLGDPNYGSKGRLTVYINNRLMGSNTNKFIPLPLGYIGRADASSSANIAATVDEVVLYDRLLSTDEIHEHYSTLHPRSGSVFVLR